MTTPIADIPASSIPAARDWLLAGVSAQFPNPQGLLVFLDEPSTELPENIICIGEVHQTYTPEQMVGSGGRFWLREDYTIDVTISSYVGGDNAAAAFTAARRLADVVVAVMRSDPSMGGAVDRAMPSGATHTSAWTEDHTGRQCDIELAIAVMNTI